MSQFHKTKTVRIDGDPVEVDEQIIPLVTWFNALPGIHTTGSCQGWPARPGKDGRAFVVFRVDLRNVQVATSLQRITKTMHTTGVHVNLLWFGPAQKGKFGGSVSFQTKEALDTALVRANLELWMASA